MTARFLLDTCIVSSPISKAPDPGIVRRLERHGHECALPAPVWHELVFGCRRLPAGRRRRALDAYLHDVVQPSFPILAYDESAAAWHGRERARLEGLGKPAPFVDGQIAAVACVQGLVLATVNARDFARFKDLTVEDWSNRRG